MPYRLRKERDGAAAASTARGGSALDTALSQIGAAFSDAAAINSFKLRIERWLVLGPRHPAVRARFGARAARLAGRDLDGAVALTERWWRDERAAFQIARAFGRGSRLSLETLRDLRVVLRLMRRKRRHGEFGAIVAAVCAQALAEAAE